MITNLKYEPKFTNIKYVLGKSYEEGMYSYLKKSTFIKMLIQQKSNDNLEPKHVYGLHQFHISSCTSDSNQQLSVEGIFLASEQKEFPCQNGEQKQFTMLDNSTFFCEINQFDEDCTYLETKINLLRTVIGKNLDKQSSRDSLFKGVPYHNGLYYTKISEYFQKTSNGDKLVHFSDVSDEVEIYQLPKEWNSYEDGVTNLEKSKIWTQNDIEEIHEIISSYQKVKTL